MSAPPSTDSATPSDCARVIGAMQLTLAGQDVRQAVSDPSSPDLVAWGNPAIVLRCGVHRPAALHPGSTEQLFSALGASGPYFLVTRDGNANVYTFVDRAVYVELTVPATYQARPVPPVARALARTLPAVCLPQAAQGGAPVPTNRLCTHRP